MSYDMHISLLAIFYVLLVDNLFRPLDSLVLISSLGFYFMYGFLINDFFDMPHDIAAGKKRPIQKIPKIAFIRIILGVVFISTLHLLYLKYLSYIATYVLAYLLATLYSAPPIRFKSRGLSGIIVNGLIEKVLPVLAVFTFFEHFGIDTVIFLATSFSAQFAEAMTHQINDYETDLRNGIRSFVVDMGIKKALRTFKKLVIPLSMTLVIFLCVLICVEVPHGIPHGIFVVVAVVGAYVALSVLISKGKLSREEGVFPLYMSCPYFLINNAFPPFLAFILSIVSPLNIILLVVALGSQYHMVEIFFNSVKEKVISRSEIVDT